ncbi:MAG: hypothetical protein BYD32DRAFT_440544 [Podila humilis]|nr:MAG: hypothetical protein BYD32DRAFT_440544 [Podila humilis]
MYGFPRENTTAVFAKLRADLELARIHADIPGMNIEVIHKGKLIFAEGYGERNKGIRLRLRIYSRIDRKSFLLLSNLCQTSPLNFQDSEDFPVCYSAILQNFSNVNFNWFWGYGKTRKDFIKRMRYLEACAQHLTNAALTSLPRYEVFHITDEVLSQRKTQDCLSNATVTKKRFLVGDEMMAEGGFPERISNKPPTYELSAYAGECYHRGFGTTTVRWMESGEIITFNTGPDGKVSGVTFSAAFGTAIDAKKGSPVTTYVNVFSWHLYHC